MPKDKKEQEIKPSLRGVSHLIGFIVALCLLNPILLAAPKEKSWPALVYGFCTISLLGISACYHLPKWKPNIRIWWRRLDHAMIFVHIAGSFTPFAYYVLQSELSETLLLFIWISVGLGVIFTLVWTTAPKAIRASLYIAVSWSGALALPELISAMGYLPVTVLLSGGVLFTIGAVIYATKKPDPYPARFGYHEIFHLLVLGGVFTHYWTIYHHVLPKGRALYG